MSKEISRNDFLEFPQLRGNLIKIIVTFVSAILLIAQGIPLYAAQCDPASGCDGCSSKAERMKCKFDRFAIEGDMVIEKLNDSSAVTDAQREGLKKAKDRYTREKGRTKSEDFHIMAKKRDVNCQLVEKTGDGDGVCDYKNGETCQEVLDDGIGNDDGICDPMNGKNREICAQICDEEAILQDENNVDESLSEEIEITYDGMTKHLEEVNQTTPAAFSSGPTPMMGTLATDPCAFYPQAERTSYVDFKKARWAAMGSRAGADVLERFCDQTFTSLFLTWTLGAACVAAETGVTVVNTWWAVVDNNESDLDRKAIDATLECAGQAMTESGKTGDQILVVQDKVNDLMANQAIIMQLLNVPPGKRPVYPSP